jgi:glycosyltransferase involved in cell wall biosynthesis
MDGVAVVILNYARWLNRNFGRCYAVVPKLPGAEEAAGLHEDIPTLRYRSVPLPFRSPYRIGLPRLDRPFLKELDRTDLDLVHAHNPFAAGSLARRYARRRRVPLVATFHSTIHEFVYGLTHSRRITQRYLRKVVDYYESADSVWVSSKFTRDILRSYGYGQEPVIIPYGTDLVPPGDAAAARAAGDAFLGTAASDNVLLYVGYVAREKNLEFLFRALGEVRQMGHPFRMVLVGEGYARPELERLARDLGIADDVRFLGLVLDRRRIELCYSRADLFLFPSYNETYSMVVREAGAFGVPSVILERTTAADIITDSVNGFVTERRVEAYAAKVAHLLTHPEEIARARRPAFEALYTPWDAVMEKVARLYRDILARGRA